MSGILPIARQLGDILDCKPVETPQQIAGPTRPSRGCWPADVWAEMQAIYATLDALDPGVWPLNEEQV